MHCFKYVNSRGRKGSTNENEVFKKLITTAMVTSLTINACMVYGQENVSNKNAKHEAEKSVKHIEDIVSTDILTMNLELGNSSSKILNGGISATYNNLHYYSTNNGLLVRVDNDEQILTSDVVANINVFNGKLYYTTFEDGNYVLKMSGLNCENQEIIHTSEAEIDNMYVVNDEYILYLSQSKIYKLNNNSKKLELLFSDDSIVSFIPTEYGYIIERNVDGTNILSADNNNLFDIENYYVEDGYLIVDIEQETYQIKLCDLFKSNFDLATYSELFCLYGKYNVSELFCNEEHQCGIKREATTTEDNSSKYLKTASYDSLNEYATVGASVMSYSLATTNSVDSLYTTATYSVDNLSQGQKNIVKRARQMVEIEWTPLQDVTGWRNQYVFMKDVTYTGVPYGWCVTRGSWVGYDITLEEFAAYVQNNSSSFYTNTAYYAAAGYISPFYSNDCSTFLSYCWNLPNRKTTTSLVSDTKMTKVTDKDNSVLQVGDCLNAKGNHVVLITARKYNSSGELIGYDIMEQTPPRAIKTSNVPLAEIDGYFDDGYIAYRYDNRNSVTYEHYCSVPIDGDTCAECSSNNIEESTLSIGSYTYPTTLTVGQSFSLKGAITSNYAISKVTVGVYTTSGTAKILATATPNAKSYNVSSLDAKITFNTLPAGTYVYKVIATDTKGTKTLLTKTFTIN